MAKRQPDDPEETLVANYVFLNNGTGVPLWRVDPIMLELEQQGHNTYTLSLAGLTDVVWERLLEWADVMTFQMVAVKLSELERAKAKGIFTIFDCDDYIDQVPEKHPNWQKTQERAYQLDFKRMVKHVDLVTVSSDVLYDHYQPNAKAIRLLRNYLPDTFWEQEHRPNTTQSIRIGWAGGVSHVEDLDFIAPVVTRICKEYPKVKFVYTGGGGWNTQTHAMVYRFGTDAFPDIPYSQKEYHNGSRPATWPSRLNAMRLDIALAPLHDSKFSRAKTPIKYFEYGINRWPGVFQNFLYGDVVKDRQTGRLATTADEWYHAIKELIDNPTLRKEYGERAYNDIKERYTYSLNGGVWLETYSHAGVTSRTRDASFFVR